MMMELPKPSATAESASIIQGDMVDVAFIPQVNEFRGERSVQMNVLDIRPNCQVECSSDMTGYAALRRDALTPELAERILPERSMLATVWRYLAAIPGGCLREMPMCLCRKIVRRSGSPMSLGQLMVCLDVFADVGLLEQERLHKYITLRLIPRQDKADLNSSRTMQRLLAAKES